MLQAPPDAPIEFGAPGWEADLRQRLEDRYFAQIRCAQAQLDDCKQAMLEQLVTPLELGYQLLYPTVERIARAGTSWMIDLAVHELIQG